MNFDRALIVAAHPDDDILGCGGILSKFKNKVQFKVLFICEGSSCRFVNPECSQAKESIQLRNSYARSALSSLGVNNVEFQNFPCGRLDQVPLLDINKVIERSIRSFSPDVVFTHSPNDSNQDHVKVYHSSVIATRPQVTSGVRSLLSYEVLTSSEWSFLTTFKPNYFVQLNKANVLDKWHALSHYLTEVGDYPYPRSKQGIITQSSYRGMQSGFLYSEAFQIIRTSTL